MTPIRLTSNKPHCDPSFPRFWKTQWFLLQPTIDLPHHSGILEAGGSISTWWNGLPLTLCPKHYLLGLLRDQDTNRHHIFLQETLFMARLLIARVWLKASTPTLRMAAISQSLPYKKVIYIHIKCPSKYHKIWDRWLDLACTSTEKEPVTEWVLSVCKKLSLPMFICPYGLLWAETFLEYILYTWLCI